MSKLCFKPVLLLFLLAFSISLSAQSSYRFEVSNVAYTNLTGDKVIPFKLMDQLSGIYRLTELEGEVFRWYRTDFKLDSIKTFHIQPYANLRFDNDSSLIIVDGGFTYLDSIDANSAISYVIDGSPADRLIKVQWKNLRIRVGNAVNFVNMQIWVYQRSGIIEIHYGKSSANNQSGFNTSSGPQVGMFYSRDDFTQCYEKLWVKGSPSNLRLDSLSNYSFVAMSGIPSEGVVFRFIPRFKTLGVIPDRVVKKGAMLLYPNPVTGGKINTCYEGNYQLMDMLGNMVMRVNGVKSIDVSMLTDGVYTLTELGSFEAVKVLLVNSKRG